MEDRKREKKKKEKKRGRGRKKKSEDTKSESRRRINDTESSQARRPYYRDETCVVTITDKSLIHGSRHKTFVFDVTVNNKQASLKKY